MSRYDKADHVYKPDHIVHKSVCLNIGRSELARSFLKRTFVSRVLRILPGGSNYTSIYMVALYAY